MKREKFNLNHVNMTNDLIRSAQGLNLGEKRLLMLAVSKLDSKAKPSVQAATVKITVAEMVQEFDLNPDKAYQEATKAAQGIMKRQIRLKPHHADTELIQWVGKAAYSKGEGWILIEFYYGLFPHLFDLKGYFASYKLSRASAFRSVYSWRLFELLMQFKSTGLYQVSLDEFRHAMEVPKAYQSDFSWLRMRVIEPAVKEIQEKDGLVVSWEPIKAGRKVKALQFTFKREQKEAKTPKRAPKAPSTPTPIEPVKRSMTKAQLIAELEGFKKLAELARLKGVDKLL